MRFTAPRKFYEIEEIKKDGRYDKIYKKWFKNTDWFKYVR